MMACSVPEATRRQATQTQWHHLDSGISQNGTNPSSCIGVVQLVRCSRICILVGERRRYSRGNADAFYLFPLLPSRGGQDAKGHGSHERGRLSGRGTSGFPQYVPIYYFSLEICVKQGMWSWYSVVLKLPLHLGAVWTCTITFDTQLGIYNGTRFLLHYNKCLEFFIIILHKFSANMPGQSVLVFIDKKRVYSQAWQVGGRLEWAGSRTLT